MNEKVIWDFLFNATKNEYGTAALMGNLMAESSLNPICTNGVKYWTEYVKDADSGKIDFVHDGYAFGLVQWCYWSRKQGLLEYAASMKSSVGNLAVQLEYMWNEFQKYTTAYKAVMNATNIREASDIVMLKYEKPANTSDAAKKKRAEYGQKFYDTYAEGKEKQDDKIMYVVATSNVRIRSGDSTDYPQVSSLKEGMTLEYVATSRKTGWYAVRIKDRICWVSKDFTRIDGV